MGQNEITHGKLFSVAGPTSYFAKISSGLAANLLALFKSLIDTGAAPNLISSQQPSGHWQAKIKSDNIPSHISASRNKHSCVGSICRIVRIGDRETWTNFVDVEKLAGDVFLETAFQDKNIRQISPKRQLVNQHDLRPIAILLVETIVGSIPLFEDGKRRRQPVPQSKELYSTEMTTI